MRTRYEIALAFALVAMAAGTLHAQVLAAPPGTGFTVSDTVAVTPPLPGPAFDARTWHTGLLRADRLQHASLALASGIGMGLLSREPVAAVSGAMTLGVAKELMDIGGSGFDWVDLLADALGAGAAAVITYGLLR